MWVSVLLHQPHEIKRRSQGGFWWWWGGTDTAESAVRSSDLALCTLHLMGNAGMERSERKVLAFVRGKEALLWDADGTVRLQSLHGLALDPAT